MFFYYQIRNHHYKTEAIPYLTCPVCSVSGHLHMSILQKYMWQLGPVAPSSKYAIAYCESCSNYVPKVKWTDEMDSAYRSLKQGLKTPLRLYRGLLVFPLLVMSLIGGTLLFIKYKDVKRVDNKAFIAQAVAHPLAGDIYQITHTDGQNTYYTYFKVTRSSGDSIYFNPSKIRIKDVKVWDDIPMDATAYEPKEIAFSISESQKDDMFKYHTQPEEYGMIWGLWKDGKLYKKY